LSDLLARFVLLASLSLFVSLQPANAQVIDAIQSNYALGATAYKEGEFRGAFDAWSLGAYEGNADSQYNLGVLYLEGRGVERNAKQARNWFLKAAARNHREAQYNLGHMALSGMGTDKSVEQALKWWNLAALGGYAAAQFNYGRALYLGVEGNQDQREGMVFIRLAAAQKDKRAVEFIDRNDATRSDSSAESIVQHKSEPDLKGSISAASPKQPDILNTQAGGVKLTIVRDQRPLSADYLARSRDTAVTVFAQADLSRAVGMLAPETLVNVMQIEPNSLQIQTAASPPLVGWIAARSLSYSGENSAQLQAAWSKELSAEEALLERLDRQPIVTRVASDVPSVDTPRDENRSNNKSRKNIVENENIWLFTQQTDALVIHLFTVLNHSKALEIAQQSSYRDRVHLFTTLSQQKQWTFLLLGPYTDAYSAQAAMKKLPEIYRKNARIREISVIAKNRCAKRSQLSAEQAQGLDAYCLD
jgi:septal ring-binding cell division protein DamX